METILAASFILILIASLGLLKKPYFLLALLVPLLIFYFLNSQSQKPDVIYEQETAYQFVQVQEKDDGTRLLLFNEGRGVQSRYHPARVLVGGYFDYLNLVPLFQSSDEARQVLIIGLAGGSISRGLLHFFDNLDIDGVEIDSEVIEIAKQFFALDEQEINIFIRDGRRFLRDSNKTYDLIVIDAYTSQLYIPFHLTTQEFFREVENSLSAEGIMSINVNASDEDSKLLIAILATIKSVFKAVEVIPISETHNHLILASQTSFDWSKLTEQAVPELRDLVEAALTNHYSVFEIKKEVLVDNQAPIELLTDKELLGF